MKRVRGMQRRRRNPLRLQICFRAPRRLRWGPATTTDVGELIAATEMVDGSSGSTCCGRRHDRRAWRPEACSASGDPAPRPREARLRARTRRRCRLPRIRRCCGRASPTGARPFSSRAWPAHRTPRISPAAHIGCCAKALPPRVPSWALERAASRISISMCFFSSLAHRSISIRKTGSSL